MKGLLVSLNTGIILLTILIALLTAGAFVMPSDEAFGLLYFMPLFSWLREAPLRLSWWLWCAVCLVALLSLNTLFCSTDSLIRKYRKTDSILLIAPQIMHLGFILIITGHLISSCGGYREVIQVREGSWLQLQDGSMVEIKEIFISHDSAGYITDTGLMIVHHSEDGQTAFKVIPNRPFLYRGTGLYIKIAYPYPLKQAIVEISREPGAIPALTGAVLFFGGNVLLLIFRAKIEKKGIKRIQLSEK